MHAHVSNSSKNMHGQLIVAFRLISGVTWWDYFDIMLLNHKERNVYTIYIMVLKPYTYRDWCNKKVTGPEIPLQFWPNY